MNPRPQEFLFPRHSLYLCAAAGGRVRGLENGHSIPGSSWSRQSRIHAFRKNPGRRRSQSDDQDPECRNAGRRFLQALRRLGSPEQLAFAGSFRGPEVTKIFFKWAIPGLFFFIFVFSIVQWVDKILPMSGFEPRNSGVRSDRSANWAKTIAQGQSEFLIRLNHK